MKKTWKQDVKEFWAAMAESARLKKEYDELKAESQRRWNIMDDINRKVEGISKSNGMSAEEYFYLSLAETRSFGGIHFDEVHRDWRLRDKFKNLQGQYDIVMLNDTEVCIVEVKYRVRKEDVTKLWEQQANTFKALFPIYAGCELYLGIAGYSFENEEDVLNEAKAHGIGVLRVKGDAVEIQDDGLKAY